MYSEHSGVSLPPTHQRRIFRLPSREGTLRASQNLRSITFNHISAPDALARSRHASLGLHALFSDFFRIWFSAGTVARRSAPTRRFSLGGLRCQRAAFL